MAHQENFFGIEQLVQVAAEKTELLRRFWGLTQDLAEALAEGETEAVTACLDMRQKCLEQIDGLERQTALLLAGLSGPEETEQAGLDEMRQEQQELLRKIGTLERENTRKAAAFMAQVREELQQAEKNRIALAGYTAGSGFPAAGSRLDQKK